MLANAKPLTLEEQLRRRVDEFNASVGHLDHEDGYDCPVCHNRGQIGVLEEYNGVPHEYYPPCECMQIRESINRLKRSGMEPVVRRCTFKTFNVETDWQRVMMDTAKAYLENGVQKGAWLFVGGAVGCGKSHICTAVCRELLYKLPVRYMTWPADSQRLKRLVNESDLYEAELEQLRKVAVLYIDDLFKPVENMPPTPADVRLAYELINDRYVSGRATIISSERYISDIARIDEAIGSRICERAKHFCLDIAYGDGKNQRIK